MLVSFCKCGGAVVVVLLHAALLLAHPIWQSLAWIICIRLFHVAIAVALCFALVVVFNSRFSSK